MILRLPIPPSVNSMFANSPNARGRGRFKTGVYKNWLKEADAYLCPPLGPSHMETIEGPYQLEIRLPYSMRGDVSNRIKAVEDFLVSRGVTPDDRYTECVTIRKDRSLDGQFCWVTIEKVPPVTGDHGIAPAN